MKKIVTTALLGMSVGFIAPVTADSDTTVVWNTDYSGKPPYQRQKENLSSVDLARFETQNTIVKSTDFRGKPPYTRNTETVRVVDLAQFETQEESSFVPTPRRFKN